MSTKPPNKKAKTNPPDQSIDLGKIINQGLEMFRQIDELDDQVFNHPLSKPSTKKAYDLLLFEIKNMILEKFSVKHIHFSCYRQKHMRYTSMEPSSRWSIGRLQEIRQFIPKLSLDLSVYFKTHIAVDFRSDQTVEPCKSPKIETLVTIWTCPKEDKNTQ